MALLAFMFMFLFMFILMFKSMRIPSRYGEIATPAMALLAENGDTKKLEIDMKSSSHNIRSVIKARFFLFGSSNVNFGLQIQDPSSRF